VYFVAAVHQIRIQSHLSVGSKPNNPSRVLSSASAALSQDAIDQVFPGLSSVVPNAAGLISSLLRTALLSVCPQIFKFLSNFGSGASSVRGAEQKALQYYWIFMLMTAFTGTSLAIMFTEAFNSGFNVGYVSVNSFF
jgi:hypothetical protein